MERVEVTRIEEPISGIGFAEITVIEKANRNPVVILIVAILIVYALSKLI